MSESKTPSRREFLKATAAGAASLAVTGISAGSPQVALGKAKSCIFINLVGGPGHLDTFDPKPEAPAGFRGPFQPIQTKVPGLHLSELFPKLATLTDKFSLIRSMHHTAPPIHECGFQLLNTGHLFRDGPEWPNVGAVLSYLLANAVISTGVNVSHGLGVGFLGSALRSPWSSEREGYTRPSSDTSIAYDIAYARDKKARFITANMFNTVFDAVSWDCHADGGSLRTDLNDIRNTVAPMFDTWFSHIIESLDRRGRLDSTLVVATGEFGRTPQLNANGGRDHWAGAWTALVAGGGVKGGRVIGRTDAKGTEPTDRPVTPQELVATIYHALGVPPDATIPGPDGTPVAVYPGKPVSELF
jgi:uncharacterized protein (DUF1501 family)